MDRETPNFRGSAALAASTSDHTISTDSQTLSLSAKVRQPGAMRSMEPRQRFAGYDIQTVPLQSILKGAREAIIDFEGAAYRLRITRNQRLILTK